MKKALIFTFTLLLGTSVSAQEDTPADSSNWDLGGVGRLSFTQVALTNWNAGGQSSISGVAQFGFFANWTKNKSSWESKLDLAYGMLQNEGENLIKNEDRIELNSKFGQEAFKHWYYTALVNFRTQFDKGYSDPYDTDSKISDFLAPAYLLTSLGMDYKPSKNFSLYISPFTGKTTIVYDQDLADAGAFGVDAATYDDNGALLTAGANIRNEFGGYLKMGFKHKFKETSILENVTFETNLDLFSNYLDRPQNIDINWTNLLAMKVNKYLEASISTHLIYDHDIKIVVEEDADGNVIKKGPRTQFKEVLGIGLSYSF